MKEVLLFNDYSAFGSNSLAVAIPILAAMEVKAHAFPTAVLNAQTGFSDYKMTALPIKEGIAAAKAYAKKVSGVLSGFFADTEQIDDLAAYLEETRPTCYLCDPVLGDHGALYPCFTEKNVAAMRKLLPYAACITPNLTEACFLTDCDYALFSEETRKKGALAALPLAQKLTEFGAKTVVITGIQHESGMETLAFAGGKTRVETQETLLSRSGTGDLFASLLFGFLMTEEPLFYSVKRTAELTSLALSCTLEPDPRYGTDFEYILPDLVKILQ